MPLTLKQLGWIALPLVVGLAGCFSSRDPVGNNGLDGECRFSSSGGVPGTTIVAIRNLTFTPEEVTIRAGGTVTWVNCEPAGAEAHTSTADEEEWSSPTLTSGDGFSHTFPQAGTYAYHCEPHPFMTGTVVVE
jgi:amicyanin